MSGHSHWAGIKHKKGLADAKRSKVFSKLAQEIIFAARGGADPSANIKLRTVVEKAKSLNMPSDNIDRAIKRGSGELKGDSMEELTIEAYGPGGIALIIECITDKKTRTIGEVRQILNRRGGKFIEGGGVRWMFERRGLLSVDMEDQPSGFAKEDAELAAIEAEARDMFWEENVLLIHTEPESVEEVRKRMEQRAIKTSPPALAWVPKEPVALSAAQRTEVEKLYEELDDNDAVQDIYSNAQ